VPDTLTIRPARDDEYPICRMLLGAEAVRPWARFLLAVQDQAPFVAGAATFGVGSRWTHGVRVHVVPPQRRRQVGTRLLTAIIAAALERGHDGILAHVNSADDPAAHPFMRAGGFEQKTALTTVRCLMKTAMDVVFPLAARVRRSRHPLADARVVRLADAPRNAVVALYLAELNRNPYTAAWSVVDELGSPLYADSPVILIGDRVAGVLLYRCDFKTSFVKVPVRIVAPEFQGGPTNLLLLDNALKASYATKLHEIEFDIPEGNDDTDKLARRLSSRVVRTNYSFVKTL
jgi:GNAT superfamily N-acetyltransferase